jgi:hypothetical protein
MSETKIYNHKRVQRIIEGCSVGVDDVGQMSIRQLNDIIEICSDCGCQGCATLLPDFNMALIYAELGDASTAGAYLSKASRTLSTYNAIAHASSN